MRAFVWLLVAFSLGVGTGLLLGGDDDAPPRTDRSHRAARFEPKTAASRRIQSTASESPPAHQNESPSHSELAGVTSDGSPFAVDPSSLGTLIIECDGERVQESDVWVYVMGMWGEQEAAWSEESLSEQGVEVGATSARYRLWPGDVRVVWSDVESRRVQVKIRAGETVIVRTDDPRVASEDPIPARLGRVVVSIRDLSGKPAANCSFVLLGVRGSEVEEEALKLDGTGRTALDLRPGPYRIVVGAQWRNVTIRAQETLELVIRNQNEGELEFVAPAPQYGTCWLQHIDGTESRPLYAIRFLAPAWRLLNVAPGTYDVFFRANGAELARNLGRVQVRARQKTTFRPKFPTGSVKLYLSGLGDQPKPGEAQLLSLDSDEPPRSLRRGTGFSRGTGDPEFRGTLVFLRLPPGRWQFKYSPRGFQSVTRVFEVADKPVEATIELRR